ncbi:MAG: PQQ-binding-like beta-propeller repeat protein [Planctomycetes bacterium]|nr:PQQ-binding-like beta-propeller repeat protein [Planctomycetota bacterium]
MEFLTPNVVPVLAGPMSAFIALLPAILAALGGLILALLKPATMKKLAQLLWRQKLPVACVVAVVFGLVYGLPMLMPGGGPEVQAEEKGAADWPMFRGGLDRRGAALGAVGPNGGGVNWSYTEEFKTFYSSPSVVGNRVYATSTALTSFSDSGAILCFDADTGGVVWKCVPKGYRSTFSSPAIAGNRLVVGEGLHVIKDARVFCLDIENKGKVLWSYATKSHVESTPCIWKDRVFVGAGDDGYYCFALEPGADGEAKVLWHVGGEQFLDCETSPVVVDGKVIVGLGMGGKALVCLDAESGKEVWRLPAPYPVFGPSTVAGGKIFFGMGNGNFIEDAETVMAKELEKMRKAGKSIKEMAEAQKTLGPIGEIWCVDLATGKKEWDFKAKRTVLGAVAAAADRIYFGSRDGFVYCIGFDGKELARWNAHAAIVTSPALTDTHVYVVTETGKCYGLTAGDLEPAFEATLGFTGPFLSSPAVARGRVYVGSQDDGLLCIGQHAEAETKKAGGPCWAGYFGGPGAGGCVDGQPLPERGKFGWRFPAESPAEGEPAQIFAAPPAHLKGQLYVPVSGARKGVLCLPDGADAAPEKETWFAEMPNGVTQSPAAVGDTIYAIDGQPDDAKRALRCLDAKTGVARWTREIAGDAPGMLALLDDRILAADGAKTLSAFDSDGQVLWTRELGAVKHAPAAVETMIFVSVSEPPALAALDRPTGKVLWRVKLDAAPQSGPLLRKGVLLLGTDKGVSAREIVNGAERWLAAGGGVTGNALALDRNRILYVSAAGELVSVDAENGAVLAKVPEALPGVPPLVSRGAVLFATATGLNRLGAGEPEAQLWTKTSWLGKFTSPPVLAASRVYFGTDKRGWICAKAK